MIRRAALAAALALGLLAAPLAAEAQQAAKVTGSAFYPAFSAHRCCRRPSGKACANWAMSKARTSSSSTDTPRGNESGFPGLAAELVRLKVDVIVTLVPACPRRQASDQHDPHCHDGRSRRSRRHRVRRQPGAAWRKHHWLVHLAPELSGKRLELLKEVVPKLSRVAVLWNPDDHCTDTGIERLELPARRLESTLQSVEGREVARYRERLRAARPRSASAVSSSIRIRCS